MARFFTGSQGKVEAGAVSLDVTGWSATVSVELHETTHSGSAGLRTYIGGARSCQGQVTFFWDAAANPTSNPPNLNPGQTVALKLRLENATGPYLDVPAAMVVELRVVSRVNGVVECRLTFQAIGAFTMPAGNW